MYPPCPLATGVWSLYPEGMAPGQPQDGPDYTMPNPKATTPRVRRKSPNGLWCNAIQHVTLPFSMEARRLHARLSMDLPSPSAGHGSFQGIRLVSGADFCACTWPNEIPIHGWKTETKSIYMWQPSRRRLHKQTVLQSTLY